MTALNAVAKRIEKYTNERRRKRLARRMKSMGNGVRVNGDIFFSGAEHAVIEDNVHIGEGAYIRAEGGLRIGANTHISRNLVVYTRNHEFNGQRLPYDDTKVSKPVDIGRNVWIGTNVCIAPGSTIGDGAIIGMGTVVSGDVPPLAIVASQPMRIVGQRDEAHYRNLEEAKAYGGPNGRPLR
jgi:acetyltransferase-like isoleucine patch superfamily enzyme